MLLPSPQRKSDQLEVRPQLETPEQIARSIERDQALSIQARRRREQTAAERDQFELTRDRIYLGVELVVIVLLLVIAVASLIAGQHGIAGVALGGGVGLSGLVAVLHRPAKSGAS